MLLTFAQGIITLRIIFAGTPEFAVPSLHALVTSTHDIIAVYTQPDRPAGRGRHLHASPIKHLAQTHDIPVYQPARLDATAQHTLHTLQPDLIVVVAYGLLLPAAVLALPRYGCLNVHASILPRWRGAAPIARAILAGDTRTGISIMQMDVGLDTGAVLHSQALDISPEDSSATLHDKLAILGSHTLLATLPLLEAGAIKPVAQENQLACYAKKLSKEEGLIDWQHSAEAIARQVRAFNPWPIAYTHIDSGERLRLWASHALPHSDDAAPPGTIVAVTDTTLHVACAQGQLGITQLQLPGGKVLSIKELRHAARAWLQPGKRLLPTAENP